MIHVSVLDRSIGMAKHKAALALESAPHGCAWALTLTEIEEEFIA